MRYLFQESIYNSTISLSGKLTKQDGRRAGGERKMFVHPLHKFQPHTTVPREVSRSIKPFEFYDKFMTHF